ncbi:hypothetical protein HID58_002216, partial [Brassica napus]
FVYPSIYVPSSVAAFTAACISVTLPFAIFATLGLDSVLLRVCSVDLEDCFWSQVWAHVSRRLASVLPHSCCSLLLLLPLSFVVLHRHRRLVCACLLSSQLISLVTLPFAMFATPDLDSVFLCVRSVCLEDYFWPQAWALISRWLSFILPPSGVCGVSLLELWSILSRVLWFFVGISNLSV